MSNNLIKNRRSFIVVSLVIIAVYYISAKLGLHLAVVQENATPVWPPTGIAIAAILYAGYRIWPAIFIGALLVNISTTVVASSAILIAFGNTLEAVIACYLVMKLTGSSYPFTRVNDYFKFVVAACIVATTLSATIGVLSLGLFAGLSWSDFWLVWSIWWAGDAVGALIITPLLLSWFCANYSAWNTKKIIEAVLLYILASFICILVFSNLLPSEFIRILVGLCLVPIFVISSYRYGVQGSSVLILLVGVISILGTAQGFGPFIQENLNESVIILQAFIAVTSLTTITLSIVVEEYDRTKLIFRYAQDELSDDEQQQTIDFLNSKNHELYRKSIWRSLAENTPDNIMLLDTEGKILFINHTPSDISVEDIVGHTAYEFVDSDNAQIIREQYDNVFRTGEPGQFEVDYLSADGPITFDCRVGAVKHGNKVIGLTVSSRNVMQRKHDEKLKNQLMDIVEATIDMVAMTDLQGRLTYMNRAGKKMMGISDSENIMATCIPDYHTPKEAERVLTEVIPKLNEDGGWQGEVEFLNRSGKIIPTILSALAHNSEKGEVEYYSIIARDISERIISENKIIESQAMLEKIINTIPVRVFWKDKKGIFLGCNQLFAEDAGLNSSKELIGKNDYDIFTAENAEHFREDDIAVMESGIAKLNFEEPQTTNDGKTIYLETNKIPLKDGDGELLGILGSYTNITERKRVEKITSTLAKQSSAVSTAETFFKDCLFNLADFYHTEFVFIGLISGEAKSHIKTFLVWKSGEFIDNFEYKLAGTPCEDVTNINSELIPEDVCIHYPEDKMLIDLGVDSYFGSPLILPNGEVFGLVSVFDTKPLHLEPWARPILDIYASRIAIELERMRTEEELQGLAYSMSYQATHDSLTDLINRREFENRLQSALNVSKVEGHHHALCYLDLDQFKVVNDTCGHIAGDELLKQLTEQLNTAIRDSDTLGRLGGDEFGLLLYDCPMDKAVLITEHILSVVKRFRFSWEEKVFELGVSIGLVAIDKKTSSINEALSAADSSCYIAKEQGRNRVHVYEDDDSDITKRHGEMQVVSEITAALDDNRFELFSQPIVPICADDSEVKHYEILIRMRDRNAQLQSPATFIGAAERYNLMPSIDRWVMKNAFSYINKLTAINTQFSLNLSGTTLSDNTFIDYIHQLREEYSFSADRVCFEITETAAITNMATAMHFISQLKAMDFKFSLDDFGAGLSSYAYLKNLPVDYIKIDGSFVSDIIKDPLNRSIVESINQIGHTIGIKTIAEWVESAEVLAVLKEIGIDYAQGFYTGKPSPLN